MWAWLERCRCLAINLRPQPFTKSVGPVKSQKFVHERVSSSLVIFKTWPAWFLVTRTTCTNGEKVTERAM